LINDSNGILCENNLEKWVEGLKILIKKKFNLEEIANNILMKYSKENVAKKIIIIYEEVLNQETK